MVVSYKNNVVLLQIYSFYKDFLRCTMKERFCSKFSISNRTSMSSMVMAERSLPAAAHAESCFQRLQDSVLYWCSYSSHLHLLCCLWSVSPPFVFELCLCSSPCRRDGRLRPFGALSWAGVRVSLHSQTERGHGGGHLQQVAGAQVRMTRHRAVQPSSCTFLLLF